MKHSVACRVLVLLSAFWVCSSHSSAGSSIVVAEASQASGVKVGGLGGLCSSLAYIRQEAQTGFRGIKGALFEQGSGAKEEVYWSNFKLTDLSEAVIIVPRQAPSSARYEYIGVLKAPVAPEAAGEFLEVWRKGVTTCYENEIAITCHENTCRGIATAGNRDLVFLWNSLKSAEQTSTHFTIYRTPLMAADTKWLSGLKAPQVAAPRNDLAGACMSSYRDWSQKKHYGDHWTETRINRWCTCVSSNIAGSLTAPERQRYMTDASSLIHEALDDPPPGVQRNWRLYSPIAACQR